MIHKQLWFWRIISNIILRQWRHTSVNLVVFCCWFIGSKVFFFCRAVVKIDYCDHGLQTMDTRRLNLKFLVAQIQIIIPNKYLEVEYKSLAFCRNNGWIIDKELTVQKCMLIVCSLAKNTPNASKKFSPKCLLKPKSFLGVRSLWWLSL